MKTKEEKIKETIKIIVTAIVSLLSLWFAISCTMSLSISKNNRNSDQLIEQKQATQVDSTNVILRNE